MDDTGRLRDAFDEASRAAGEAAVRQPVTGTSPNRKKDIGKLLARLWEMIEAQDAEVADLRQKAASAEDGARRAARFEEQLRQVAEELEFVQQDREAKRQEVERARETIRELQESLLLAQQRPAPGPPPPGPIPAGPSSPSPGTRTFEAWTAAALPAPPPPPVADASPADRLARAFAQWCASSGAINGRADLFQAALRASLPDADVRTVYRDADSPARPVVLRPDATGNSAVAYWLVAYDGRYALLPQPMGPQQFRELAPCYDGAAAPATLAAIEPATVQPSGDGFELVAPGHVL